MLDLRAELAERCRQEGFHGFGICDPGAAADQTAPYLPKWLADGMHGDMAWMAERVHWRGDPRQLWPAAQSVIVVADSYAAAGDPLAAVLSSDHATIATYAQGRDYHDHVKKRLKRIARWLQETAGGEVKVFVDTAPVMEKPLAAAAGIGWQGKHSNLVSTELGSWFVLGEIFTTLHLPRDTAHSNHCGSCRRCLDICPTAAFTAPYQLDARRCISYLTIELKAPIPRSLRPQIGNRVFGCDDCLAVCPWNKFASAARTTAHYRPLAVDDAPTLRSIVRLTDSEFRERFKGTPIRRTGRDRIVRNTLIAIGNSADPSLVPDVEKLLADPSPLVRGAAVWAMSRLLSPTEFRTHMNHHLDSETSATVREEWRLGLVESTQPATP